MKPSKKKGSKKPLNWHQDFSVHLRKFRERVEKKTSQKKKKKKKKKKIKNAPEKGIQNFPREGTGKVQGKEAGHHQKRKGDLGAAASEVKRKNPQGTKNFKEEVHKHGGR